MELIPLVSIVLEAVIALLALVFAFKGRPYLLGLVVTFGIYVYYDLVRHYGWESPENLLSVAFLIATVTALISVVYIIRNTGKK